MEPFQILESVSRKLPPPKGHPRPPTLQKFGSAADSGNHCKRCADDGVLAIRGALIGTAIGLVLWAAMFGLWYWL